MPKRALSEVSKSHSEERCRAEETQPYGCRLAGGFAMLATFGLAAVSSHWQYSRQNLATTAVQMTSSHRTSYRGSTASLAGDVISKPGLKTDGSDPPPPREAPSWKIKVSNEYGEYGAGGLRLYGYDHLVEPYRDTRLEVVAGTPPTSASSTRFLWSILEVDEDGQSTHAPTVSNQFGEAIVVAFRKPGTRYYLSVQEIDADGAVVGQNEAHLVCKYVRRELRALTEADKGDFLDAMEAFYRLDLDEGRARYGEGFVNYQVVTAMHNSNAYCYHDGLQFLSSHWGFNLLVERSLQMINPKTALHYWDFMIEAGTLGAEWPSSPVFGADMFGSAMGSAQDEFQVLNGRFAGVKTVYDPGSTFAGPDFKTQHNAYGYINSKTNDQDVPYISRTHSYCGLRGNVSFATCDKFIGCFDQSSSLYDWEVCMERQIHANMHGWLGGAWGCETNFADWLEDYSISPELMTFVLNYITANRWPSNGFFDSTEYVHCPGVSSCLSGESCACSCRLDVDALNDTQVYELCDPILQAMSKSYNGDVFTNRDPVTRQFSLQQHGKPLPLRDNSAVLREMVKLGCRPGKTGQMSTGASPNDPIFWVLHPLYEKALHVLLLSPKYSDTYDLTWVDQGCSGSKSLDELPFTPLKLGMGTKSTLYTNVDIMAAAHPSNLALPYVYDQFDTWGTCKWDPCPDCI